MAGRMVGTVTGAAFMREQRAKQAKRALLVRLENDPRTRNLAHSVETRFAYLTAPEADGGGDGPSRQWQDDADWIDAGGDPSAPVPNRVAFRSRELANNVHFGNFVILCIVAAGMVVGVQTYEEHSENPVVLAVDYAILGVFSFEVILKMVAEGRRPWIFFVGPEWKWNNFDFIIVVACLPLGVDINVSFVRLLRLLRVTKIIKRIPELQVIAQGLMHGLGSIFYIVILLLLVFYLFAVAGVFAFRGNDPAHFSSVPVAMLTLFRCATLEDWSDVLYINLYGCDAYDSGLYEAPVPKRKTPSTFRALGAQFNRFDCVDPQAMPVTSTLYFLTFTVIASFIMLSLFIGAVTMGMAETMEEREKAKEAEKAAARDADNAVAMEATPALDRRAELMHAVEEAWSGGGQGVAQLFVENEAALGPWWRMYLWLARQCRKITLSSAFQNTITGCILAASLLVGMSTAPNLESNLVLKILDLIILGVFTLEVFLKIIAEGFKPLRYFDDGWNRFDFSVVAATLVPLLAGLQAGSIVSMLRLLRLLRVLKLVKGFPQLAIIIDALITGFSSVTYISIILLLFLYMCAIIARMLYGTNDNWHFGSLQKAMMTLFRCATLEDWTDVMYIQMFGCREYQGDGNCPQGKSSGLGWVAAVYFLIFTLIGALVLLTLFIGVVTTSMDEAQTNYRVEAEMREELEGVMEREGISPQSAAMFEVVFRMVDDDLSGVLSMDEIKPIIGLFNDPSGGRKVLTDDEMGRVFMAVDADGSGEIDLAEFVALMVLLRKVLRKDAAGEIAGTTRGSAKVAPAPPLEARRDSATRSEQGHELMAKRKRLAEIEREMAELRRA